MGVGTLFKLGLIGVILSIIPLYFRYNDLSKLDCKTVKLPTPPKLVGPLSINSYLEQAEHLLEGKIVGPESLVVEGETVYTGLYDGRIVKIVNGKIVKTVRLTKEKECGNFDSEPRCGRPLGMRRFDKEQFVVIDAYLGIYLVNIEQNSFKQIYKSTTPIDGHRPRFLNDVDILNSDELIVSDSSLKYDRRHFIYPIMEQSGDGRVFHYQISTQKATVLLDGLHFANGVQLLADGASFVVAETSMARIQRYYLSGPNKGKTEVFAENLPGLPDNIRMSTNGTLWIGFAGIRHEGLPSMVDRLATVPQVRQFLIDIIPSQSWLSLFPVFSPSHSLVVQLDQNGKIVSSLHDITGKHVRDVSQVTDGGEFLYFGSFHNNYLGKVKK